MRNNREEETAPAVREGTKFAVEQGMITRVRTFKDSFFSHSFIRQIYIHSFISWTRATAHPALLLTHASSRSVPASSPLPASGALWVYVQPEAR